MLLARHRAALAWLALLLGGCTLPPLTTPTPRATPTVTPLIPSATATPSLIPSPSQPGLASVPTFEAGAAIDTAADGLRVRRSPGTERSVLVERLPLGARLQVILGPLPVDGLGWYLVRDVDEDEPTFGEGWIAAGFEPDAFVALSSTPAETDPYPASFAHVGDAEVGPISIPDEHHAIRWAAVDPAGEGCTFAVDLRVGAGDPLPAIRAVIGTGPTPGRLGAEYFADQPGLRGQAFVQVTTTCAWALTLERIAESPPDG